MDLMAEQLDKSQLNVAIDQQALALISSSHDSLLLAEEHHRLAVAAERAGLADLAEKEFLTTSGLFSSTHNTEIAESYKLGAEIGYARMERYLGRQQSALGRISGLRDQVLKLSNRYVTADYYQVYGNLLADDGRLQEAEKALQITVNIAELELNSLSSERDRINWAKQMGSVYLDLVEVKLDQGDTEGALEALEFYRSSALPLPASRPRSFSTAMTTFPNETIVVYGLLPHGIAIWILDGRTITVERAKVNPDFFRRLVERFQTLCSNPSSPLDAVYEIAHKMYAILIFPIAEHLKLHSTLLIDAADTPLNKIPFQALMDADRHFLVEQHPIIYSPGLLYLTKPSRHFSLGVEERPLVVANPSPNPVAHIGSRPLVDVEEEANDIVRQLPASRLLLGSNATLVAVRNELPRSTLFHFAGHSGGRYGNVGLVLKSANPAASDLLDFAVLQDLDLSNVQLAVLSACDTENGPQGSPEDWQSLVRGFLRAGVPHVVASRWSIDSTASRTLMRAFYTHLVSGRDFGQALASAELQLSHAPNTEHPYYWAGFDAFGEN